MSEIFDYIIRFLLGENLSAEIVAQVGYTSNQEEFQNYKLVIVPSTFFSPEVYGTPASLPHLPLQIWEEAPIIFGTPVVEQFENTRVLHADLIASTYFLISRYEEIVRPEVRDIHGRFPGKESLPYRAGFIDSPLVDEYSKLLRVQLRETGCEVPEPPKQIQKIYLTHDLDQIAHFRTIRGMIGGVLRGIKRPKEGNKALKSFFGGLRYDPWYTFPYLYKMDNELMDVVGLNRCESIIFIRAGIGRRKEDKPYSNLIHPDYRNLIRYSKRKGITIGLHSSYDAGISPDLVPVEKNRLEQYNRHHYLGSREPIDMVTLIDAGITDDFTLGYADMAGFRLGTCRSVRWINPINKQLTTLTLHPLTIMDGSLSDKRYMYMNSFDAYQYCVQLINSVENYNGELTLLWHNTSVEKIASSYHRKLYKDLIKYLQTK